MQETKKMAPSRIGIPPDAQAEILQKLSAETKITSCEIAEILKKHDVCGDTPTACSPRRWYPTRN